LLLGTDVSVRRGALEISFRPRNYMQNFNRHFHIVYNVNTRCTIVVVVILCGVLLEKLIVPQSASFYYFMELELWCENALNGLYPEADEAIHYPSILKQYSYIIVPSTPSFFKRYVPFTFYNQTRVCLLHAQLTGFTIITST
jgi:hypothetical protein